MRDVWDDVIHKKYTLTNVGWEKDNKKFQWKYDPLQTITSAIFFHKVYPYEWS